MMGSMLERYWPLASSFMLLGEQIFKQPLGE